MCRPGDINICNNANEFTAGDTYNLVLIKLGFELTMFDLASL